MAKRRNITAEQNQLTFNFDVNKFENFNATVNELRTGIFAPIEKISTNSITYKNFIDNKRARSIETNWGEVIIKGNILTQTHRDLLDCILSVSDQPMPLNDGRVAYYFKIADVMKVYDSKSSNYEWIKQKLDEIQTTAIQFKQKDSKSYVSFNILDKSGFSENQDSFGIVFTKSYRDYIENNLTVDYRQELPKLLKVDSALLKAIVRFFWTHKHCNISILQLLQSIGYPIESERAIRTAKKEIKDNANYLEKEFGIFYNSKENLLYTQINTGINFINPTTNQLEKNSTD